MRQYKAPQDRGMPLNLYLPYSQVLRLNALADREGSNRSAIVGKALDMLLNSANTPLDDSATNGQAAMQAATGRE